MSPTKAAQNLDNEMVRQGATLRAFRELRGLKVGEFATALGISYAYLSNIEAGRKRLTPQLLVKASGLLGVRQVALIHPDTFGEGGRA
jgi:transcriptional regulator with XRE-family HTH domain